jgi:recombination protein RecR
MPAFSGYLESLTKELMKLPGMGHKSASRIAFHVLSMDSGDVRRLADSLVALKENVRECAVCGGISDGDICPVCADPARDKSVICVVEKQKDALTIEKTGAFKGLYHVLGGVISPLDGVSPDDLSFEKLLSRCKEGGVRKILTALNPTIEGDATVLYCAQILRPLDIKVLRIARGLPVGADIDYTDSATIARSISDSVEV